MTGADAVLPTRDFPGNAALAGLVVPPSTSTRPYVDHLTTGELALQRCSACGRHRHPIAPVCPYCGATTYEWHASSGKGIVVSWVRYPRSYLPEFEKLVPYVVLCVELEEGARLFGRLASDAEPSMGMKVSAIIERWTDGGHAPAFVPDGGGQ
jgi:uncharacterized OB-fold protein